MSISLSECLRRDAVVADLNADGKPAALRGAALALVQDLPQRVQQACIRTLEEREQLGSTATGDGIAIPHGKIADLDQLRVGVARQPDGVDFDADDGAPVYLIFTILAPAEQQGSHLQVLARISRIVGNDDNREALLAAASNDELYDLLLKQDHAVPA